MRAAASRLGSASRTCALGAVAALAAASADAQTVAPGAGSPEALTALAMEACVFATTEPSLDEDVLSVAGLRLVEREDASVTYEDEREGLALTIALRPGYAGCEMTVRDAPRGLFDAWAVALGAALGEAFEVADLETLEDGQMWRISPAEGLRLRVGLERRGQDLLLTGATEPNRVMENSE